MGSTHHPLSIAIMGGGIAGLSLAAALVKKPHLDIHVYEAVPAHSDVGAGLALHRNALAAMALLGPEVHQAYLDKAINIGEDAEAEMATDIFFACGPHANTGADQEPVAELGRAKGRKSVSRADLLAGLLGLVPGEKVSFGKRLTKIWEEEEEEKVKFEFGDGTKGEADCVLGADGIRSVVRGYVVGEDHPARHPVNHDRWQVYRTVVTTEEAIEAGVEERFTRTVPILLGPRGHVNCIPMNKGTRLSAGVAVRGAALGEKEVDGPGKGNDEGRRKELDVGLYKDYTPEARAIVDLVARDTSASWAVGDHDNAPVYFKGRVAMLGDAAHASLPFAGNGAAQALEDAAVLDHLFERVKQPSQIEAALGAYDAVRRPRSQDVVDVARMLGRAYAFAERDIHEDPKKARVFFTQAGRFTNEADLTRQNEEAMAKMEDSVRGISKNN
ncbi:Putative salicylate hydroxylase [Podospora comata]|uniref:Salicylate hydroxylase n=1 Tax=Podospora comata TaxID=48703 RepID=A0ABY6SBU7_PODCO|nr:Putative salicylate hydroxylase [Podospora comata]